MVSIITGLILAAVIPGSFLDHTNSQTPLEGKRLPLNPLFSANARWGFLKLTNPNKPESFKVMLSEFDPIGNTLRPFWRDSTDEERLLAEGEYEWLPIMEAMPAVVPGWNPKQSFDLRFRQRERTVRFLGGKRAIETRVPVYEWRNFTVDLYQASGPPFHAIYRYLVDENSNLHNEMPDEVLARAKALFEEKIGPWEAQVASSTKMLNELRARTETLATEQQGNAGDPFDIEPSV